MSLDIMGEARGNRVGIDCPYMRHITAIGQAVSEPAVFGKVVLGQTV